MRCQTSPPCGSWWLYDGVCVLLFCFVLPRASEGRAALAVSRGDAEVMREYGARLTRKR